MRLAYLIPDNDTGEAFLVLTDGEWLALGFTRNEIDQANGEVQIEVIEDEESATGKSLHITKVKR